jgi:hypothetical protein
MAGRIRTIKPEAFTDEKLWDAEQDTGLPLFRAFSGLWCQADKEGRFEWRPRPLKAAVLPYWEGDFSRVLDAFVTHGFLVKYRCGDREYGCIPNFRKHQFINGKEPESTMPAPPASVVTSDTSRVSDASATRDGRVGHAPIPSPSLPIPSTPEGEAGEGDRETVVPLDLTERAERAGIPEQFAKAYRAPIEVVRAEIRETVTYWSIGGGAGKRKKRWLSVLRTRLHERGKAGALNVPEPEPTLDPGETRRKRETEERAITERRRSEVAAAVGAQPNVDAARAALAALSQELGE